jgi:hypothetical protein
MLQGAKRKRQKSLIVIEESVYFVLWACGLTAYLRLKTDTIPENLKYSIMKSLLFATVLFPLYALLAQADPGAITDAMKRGNAADLGRYFDERVEISILNKDDVYTKEQAVKVMQQFFANNPASSFTTVHKGTSSNKDSHYCIGNLVAGGKTFRVYIYMKNAGSKQVIQELRFDKE